MMRNHYNCNNILVSADEEKFILKRRKQSLADIQKEEWWEKNKDRFTLDELEKL